jgi:hypothetical protein
MSAQPIPTVNTVRMSKRLIIVLAVALATAAVSCSHDVSRILTCSLPHPNPTSYTFPLPPTEVHTKALEAFSSERQTQAPIFSKSTGKVRLISVLSAECLTNAVQGKAVFDDPANARDVYLHSFHTPFVNSSVYRGCDGGLPFCAAFHLHLADATTHAGLATVVTVTASDTEVLNGTKFGIGSCGPGQKWNWVKVKPTTVEEYSILTHLGRHLGITNMPAVLLPAEAPEK